MENNQVYTSEEILIIVASGGINRFGEFEDFINQDGSIFIPDFDIIGPLFINQNSNGTKRDVIFSNCTFKDEINIHQHERISSFYFNKCTFEKSVSFYQIRTTISLNSNCHFKGQLAINGNGDTVCNISDITIDGLFIIQGTFSNKFSLQNINVNNDNSEKKGTLKFAIANFQDFEANNITVSSFLIETSVVFTNSAVFKLLNVNQLNLDKVNVRTFLILSESYIQDFYAFNFKRGGLTLRNTTIKEATFDLSELNFTDISECDIDSLRLYGDVNKDNAFKVHGTNISLLEFNSITNEGILSFADIDIPAKGKLCIQSSNLGKADFISCRFSEAAFEFENSKISEIFIVETDFPKSVLLDGTLNHAQAQLAFGQLHTLLQKQGDTVRSLEYQAREIEAHYKILKQKSYSVSSIDRLYKRMQISIGKLYVIKLLIAFYKRKSFVVNKVWSEVRLVANIFSLWLNNISNKFGRSWQRGVLFSLGIGVLFFYFLVLSSEQYSFGFPIIINPELVKSYLKFMNPLRFFDLEYLFKNKNDPNNPYLSLDSTWCFVWDFFGRVFVAYGYYQTIQAFRRFGRK